METINHECYGSLEVAKLLKEAGFKWFINTAYRDGVLVHQRNLLVDDFNGKCYEKSTSYEYFSAPTLDIAQRWLREVKKFHIDIQITDIDNIKYGFIIHEIYEEKNPDIPFNNGMLHFVPFGLIYKGKSDKLFNTYEDAQEAGIKKALELILDNK